MRLAIAIIGAAKHEQGAILGPELTKEMLTVQADSYGLGLNLADAGDGQVFWHGGSNVGFQSELFAYSDGHGGAAIMTNGPGGYELANEIKVSIAAAYGWKYGAAEERNAVTLTNERAAQYVGVYVAKMPPEAGRPDMSITVSAAGNTLWAEMGTGAPKLRLYVASDTQVFFRVSPIFKVDADANGRPTSIELAPGLVAVRQAE